MNQIFEYFIQIFASKKEIEKAPKYVISEVPKANNKLSLEKNSENNNVLIKKNIEDKTNPGIKIMEKKTNFLKYTNIEKNKTGTYLSNDHEEINRHPPIVKPRKEISKTEINSQRKRLPLAKERVIYELKDVKQMNKDKKDPSTKSNEKSTSQSSITSGFKGKIEIVQQTSLNIKRDSVVHRNERVHPKIPISQIMEIEELDEAGRKHIKEMIVDNNITMELFSQGDQKKNPLIASKKKEHPERSNYNESKYAPSRSCEFVILSTLDKISASMTNNSTQSNNTNFPQNNIPEKDQEEDSPQSFNPSSTKQINNSLNITNIKDTISHNPNQKENYKAVESKNNNEELKKSFPNENINYNADNKLKEEKQILQVKDNSDSNPNNLSSKSKSTNETFLNLDEKEKIDDVNKVEIPKRVLQFMPIDYNKIGHENISLLSNLDNKKDIFSNVSTLSSMENNPFSKGSISSSNNVLSLFTKISNPLSTSSVVDQDQGYCTSKIGINNSMKFDNQFLTGNTNNSLNLNQNKNFHSLISNQKIQMDDATMAIDEGQQSYPSNAQNYIPNLGNYFNNTNIMSTNNNSFLNKTNNFPQSSNSNFPHISNNSFPNNNNNFQNPFQNYNNITNQLSNKNMFNNTSSNEPTINILQNPFANSRWDTSKSTAATGNPFGMQKSKNNEKTRSIFDP